MDGQLCAVCMLLCAVPSSARAVLSGVLIYSFGRAYGGHLQIFNLFISRSIFLKFAHIM